MRFILRRPVLAALVGCMWTVHLASQQHVPITVTRLYSGPDGQTHVAKTEVKLMPSATFAGLEISESVKVSGAQFYRLPPGNVQDWHNPQRRQYVVTLSGLGEVELAGGQKIRLTPGQVVLAEDVTGKGHITRSIGSEDLIFFIVPLATQ